MDAEYSAEPSQLSQSVQPTNCDSNSIEPMQSGQRDQSTPCAPPPAKRLKGATSKSTKSESSAALRNASSVMNAVAARLSLQPKEQPRPNATRLFCDMMYEKLMKIENEEEREMLQYEIYGIIMRPQRYHPTSESYRQSQQHASYRDPSDASVAMYAHEKHNNGSSFVASAIASAMSSTNDGFSESDISSDYQQEYFMM